MIKRLCFCCFLGVAGSFNHLSTALTWTGAYKDDATVESTSQ